jgi:anti-anti-sigma factor
MIDWHCDELGENGEILVFRVSGRLETMECDYLSSAIDQQIQDGHKKVIIDCGELDYISSTGLGMLLRLHARQKKRGGVVKLARVQGTVAQLLEVVQLDRILNMYPTVQEAVESHEG